MKAIGYTAPGPLDGAGALIEFSAERPSPGPRDLLVAVKAVSVNPVDSKVRSGAPAEPAPRILGFDAAGVVVATGAEVTLFKAGDEVFYAGDINRPGSNAQFQLVDERITARKPASLSFAEAAAVPLTAITAWEMLFDCFGITEGAGEDEALLIIGGAGGVGSIMIQLAKALTGLTVIATASRPETSAWARQMGADHVVDHHRPLDQEMAKLGLAPRYVAALTQTDQHFDAIIELIAPRGHVSVIDDPATLDIKPGKRKALSFSWEFMFTRPMFATADMIVQHELLSRVSTMLDEGTLKTTMNADGGMMTAENLTAAHRHQESGTAIGKTVLTVETA